MFGQNSFAALSSAVDQPVPSSSALQLSEEQGEEADIDVGYGQAEEATDLL